MVFFSFSDPPTPPLTTTTFKVLSKCALGTYTHFCRGHLFALDDLLLSSREIF